MIQQDDIRRATPRHYRTLLSAELPEYLQAFDGIATRLGGTASQWHAREMGDGNLNLVFIVEGPAGAVVVKQALPYVRMVGSSWPLSLRRSHFEQLALTEQARWAANFVPALYHVDPAMAAIVMQYLAPHVVLRKAIIGGLRFPSFGAHLGTFLAHAVVNTSDLAMSAASKKARIAEFLGNTAMCKISEDLIFDEPYFAAPMNRHTAPYLNALVSALRADVPLKLAVQQLKWNFMNQPECLVHGDLHTGSVMVTADDTRVIDPEFAFYGPMGFDVGMLLGNLLMGCFSAGCTAQRNPRGEHATGYPHYLLEQADALWKTFAARFAELWSTRPGMSAAGEVYHQRLWVDSPDLAIRACEAKLADIWRQALGFAGAEMIRRVVGLSHVEDFESIDDPRLRADREARAIRLGRELLVDRVRFADIQAVTRRAQVLTREAGSGA